MLDAITPSWLVIAHPRWVLNCEQGASIFVMFRNAQGHVELQGNVSRERPFPLASRLCRLQVRRRDR